MYDAFDLNAHKQSQNAKFISDEPSIEENNSVIEAVNQEYKEDNQIPGVVSQRQMGPLKTENVKAQEFKSQEVKSVLSEPQNNTMRSLGSYKSVDSKDQKDQKSEVKQKIQINNELTSDEVDSKSVLSSERSNVTTSRRKQTKKSLLR